MQIPVADVAEQRNFQAVFCCDLADAPDDLRDRAARHGDIFAEFVRAAARQRRGDRAPRGSQPSAPAASCAMVTSRAACSRAMTPIVSVSAVDDVFVITVDAEEQNRIGVQR